MDHTEPNYAMLNASGDYSPAVGRRLRAAATHGVFPSGAAGMGQGFGTPWTGEPAGDAGEGYDLPLRVRAPRSRDDRSYRPHPALPSSNQLDYVQKFAGAGLITIGLLVLLILFVLRPKKAKRLVGRAAKSKAGV